jgi:pSer/pThr/pTyr-binding forkhead associated (FHA) protein
LTAHDNPVVSRASDDTREQTVAVLRRGLLAGRLGTDTFVERVDAAYRAKTHDELGAITDDLPRHRRVWDAVRERLALGTQAPRSLRPPRMSEGDRVVLGRDNGCDFRIADTTVSSRHAELVRISDGWLIRDLHSRNGTRVNGWLIDEHELRPGDTITLGSSVFLFRPPSPA